MDIYNYLKKDHQKVNDLFDRILATKNTSMREMLFNQVKDELVLHMNAEEATLYVALKRFSTTEEKIDHVEEEHVEIIGYLNKLNVLSLDSEIWMEQFGEFKHAVMHHVEEEEGSLFEKARKLLSKEEAVQLAADMDALKQQKLKKTA